MMETQAAAPGHHHAAAVAATAALEQAPAGRPPACRGGGHNKAPPNGSDRGPRGAWAGQHSDTAAAAYRDQGRARGHHAVHAAQGGKAGVTAHRRQRNYKKLWDHVKSVHAGDTHGGRNMPREMSVEELVKVCVALPPDASAVAAVGPGLAYLDSRAMAALMKELARAHALPRALELFNHLVSLPAEHELYAMCDVYTFTTAISLMGQSQQLRRALELVGEMRSRGLAANVHTYSALMNVCIKCDACDLALDVFQQMHEDRVRPNVVTFNTLVDVFGKTGQWERAVAVLDGMRKEDLEPEVRTFNTAIIACNMCGQPLEALKVYQKLLDAGLAPSATTYTALISAYGKVGQLDKALDVFQAMVTRGCERSVITYSALISACEKAGRWELALQLFERMQREGCTPNTVTFNSLITACQQGGQPDKACEVFERMKYHGCRPDVVTYSALISAHHRAGQWRRALRAFEAMQAGACKPDAYAHQMVVDALWGQGVAWAQARAAQLYASAARAWPYRFTVQAASTSSPLDAEFVLPASTPGVGVLALRKWLGEMAGHVEADGGSLLAPPRQSLVLSLGRSRHVKEPGSSDTCQALMAVLRGFRSPFRPGNGAVTAPGNIIVAEADAPAALAWLSSPELPELLALLLPPPAVARQPSPLGGHHHHHGGPGGKRVGGFSAELAEDTRLEDSCTRAYNMVLDIELAQQQQHPADAAMAPGYLAERPALIARAFELAAQLGLADEVAFDAGLLMDRVMATGAEHDPALGSLFVAAALRLAALQAVPGDGDESEDSAAAAAAAHGASAGGGGVPTDAVLTAATGFPAGSVARMEDNICTALGGDTRCISALRSLKLFLERMGAPAAAQQQQAPAAAHFQRTLLHLLRSVVLDPLALRWRPAVVAAATLTAARATVGCYPFFPGCLATLTQLSLEAAGDGDEPPADGLAAAVTAIDPLAMAAGLVPPARASPIPQLRCGAPRGGGGHPHHHLHQQPHPFGGSAPGSLGSMGGGSGFSTPGSFGGGTPTAAAAAAMAAHAQYEQQQQHKSLLDAIVRQHAALRRGSSDASSMSACSDVGSAGDLHALLSASAAVSGSLAAGSPLVGSPLTSAASEPALAAAMAGLQLGMLHGGVPHMPWLAAGGGFADGYPQSAPLAQQQQGAGSRLQHMTNPFVSPPQHMPQPAMFSGMR